MRSMSKNIAKSSSKKHHYRKCPTKAQLKYCQYPLHMSKKLKCSTRYRAYGFTSDSSQAAMGMSNHCNPYEEMESKLKTNNVKALERSLFNLTLRRRKEDHRPGWEGDDSNKGSSPAESHISGGTMEHEDYQDDDEEDFLNQDADLSFPKVNGDSSEHSKTRTEQLRDVQITVMEGICKQINPKDLIGYIRDQGYFSHCYDRHARTVDKSEGKGAPGRRDVGFLYTMLGRNVPTKTGDH